MREDETPTAPGSPTRRFAIGDGMILVALAACYLAMISQTVGPARAGMYARNAPGLVRYLWFGGDLAPLPMRGSSRAAMVDYLRSTPGTILAEFGLPLLVLATPALLLIRLRKPRPTWRALLRQPGAAAVLAAVLEVLIEVDLRWLEVPVPTPMPMNIGLAVALAWAVLGVARLWRAERSWIDRIGRVLGVGWIALSLVVAAAGWAD